MLGAIALQGLAAAVLVHVAWCDMRWRRIANRDVLLLAALGAVAAVLEASPFGLSLGQALLGMALALLALLPFYLLRWMGAGDVKLAAAMGMWLGAVHAGEAWVISVLLAVAWGLGLQWARSGPAELAVPRAGPHMPPLRQVPYGMALSLAAVAVWWLRR
ncbi:MAG: prepilin peptidase [Comamonas sp.]|jgi:prepilin peptidase CpaA|nr:prepilin peptidase [Comamonas sp.]